MISAVSKPNFARKYAFESSRRDLHNALPCTALKSHFFQKFARICQNFAKFFRNLAELFAEFCKIFVIFLQIFVKFVSRFFHTFTDVQSLDDQSYGI